MLSSVASHYCLLMVLFLVCQANHRVFLLGDAACTCTMCSCQNTPPFNGASEPEVQSPRRHPSLTSCFLSPLILFYMEPAYP